MADFLADRVFREMFTTLFPIAVNNDTGAAFPTRGPREFSRLERVIRNG
jgi:hypothetical protein